jgi:hypothetical protein
MDHSEEYIDGLRDSMTYRLAVQMYRQHHDPPDGVCHRCDRPAPCPPRRHAAAVIEAAGDDPRRYDVAPPAGRHRHDSASDLAGPSPPDDPPIWYGIRLGIDQVPVNPWTGALR